MLYTIARTAGLIALLCSLALTASLPSEYSAPEVPWKRDGLRTKRTYGYGDGCKHGPYSRSCWDGSYTIDTDMDLEWPDTGKTVTYYFEIAEKIMAPDGFARPMTVINGQYPGPTIEASWGDTIEVFVTSKIQANGTGIHWHGMRQLGSVQMDGVGGVTECPIAPGETKHYKFKATQYGSSWYHSHYSVQYGDGVVGGIMIHGPATANYDIDLGILPFTDWFHIPSFPLNAVALHSRGPPIPDSLLINGTVLTPKVEGGKYAVTTLTPGKKHRLRLLNSGINNYVHVSLDGHPFTVIAADFVPIVPFETTSLSIAVGQRYDVIIDACQSIGNYWLRVGPGGTGGLGCDGPGDNLTDIKSIFHYEGAHSGAPNSTGITLPLGCYDEENIVPWVKTQVPQDVPEEIKLGFTNSLFGPGLVQWLVDENPMLVDFNKPTLQYVLEDNITYTERMNVYPVGEKHKWQYWVIQQNQTGNPPLPHPIHLHGHDFYVLDYQTNATWSGDISRLKSDNPIRRDTATLPAGGYLVLAFESDNPGIWLMHCHIPFHVSAGFGLQFVERGDEIVDAIGNVDGFQEGCNSWRPYQVDTFPGGFTPGDSGL
ncbi:laccase [Lojkania enalia]|uniref:Laccase n=1 Tax=Lojkania enalia TaxID=147567 RepID=A0A9P4N8T6_9PLEO|nr:laccase [Didymosphaeria enalia]